MKKVKLSPETLKAIEKARKFWAGIARKNGWYFRPFYIQVWVRKDGTIADSVAHKGMKGAKADHIEVSR